MSDEKSDITTLNNNYQKCLNQYYDNFFDGNKVSFDNICLEQLGKLKAKGSYFKDAYNEFESFKSKEKKTI